MAIDKVKFPNGNTENIQDSRIPGVDSTPTANSANLVTSGGIKSALDGYIPKGGLSTADGAIATWGTLTSANSYSPLLHWASSDGGDLTVANKSGQISMQLDGLYYQNEGRYRVLDASDIDSTVASQSALSGYLPLTGGTMQNTNLVANLNADLLGGLRADDFTRSFGTSSTTSSPIDLNNVPSRTLKQIRTDYRWSNMPQSGIGAVVHIPYSQDWIAQIFAPINSDAKLFVRNRHSGTTWTEWHEIAYTDSVAASATKLETARTIWGQNFDGSADVSGAMTGVTSIDSLLNFDTTNNRLGIRVVAPAYPLDVDGVIRAEKLIGTATGITETSLEDEEFTYQATPINDIADGYRVDKIKGKTLVWNQLAKDLETQLFWAAQYGSISNGQYDSGSVPSGAYGLATADRTTLGHIYILSFYITNNATVHAWVGDANSVIVPNSSRVRKSIRLVPSAGNSRPLIGFNCNVNGATYQIGNICLFDLTQMFGAGNEPSTAEEFEAMFPEAYYDYNPGELINNSAEAIETVGFNQWDEEYAVGAWTEGSLHPEYENLIYTKNYIRVIPGDYYISAQSYVNLYDSQKNYVRMIYLAEPGIYTVPNDISYLKLTFYNSPNYSTPICVNLSDPDRNGEYEPYWSAKIALGLSSIKVKDSNGNIHEINGLASAGDVYDEIVGGKLIKRIGSYTLTGSESWTANGSNMYRSNFTIPRKLSSTYWGTVGNLISSRLTAATNSAVYNGAVTSAVCFTDSTSAGYIGITKDVFTNIASYVGTTIYYELATPVTYELVSPVPLSGRIDGNGTMRVISDGPVAPFKGDITYGCNPGQMGADSSRLKSYLDSMLEIKVVNGVPMLHTTLPFYSDSFVGAGSGLLVGESTTPSLGTMEGATALGIKSAIERYGLWEWVTGNGTAHLQSGRGVGNATAYPLCLQELGGNVGIGTDTPNYKLDVAGDVRGTAVTTTLQTSQPSGGMLPNREYKLGTLSSATTFTLAAETSGVTNHYFWTFETGSTAPSITWPSAITSWAGGSAPSINSNKHYEVSVLNGVAVVLEV